MRLTPHVASNHTLVRHVFLEKVGENLGRFVRGEELLDRVDPTLGYQAACGDRRRRRLDEARSTWPVGAPERREPSLG